MASKSCAKLSIKILNITLGCYISELRLKRNASEQTRIVS